MTYVPWRKGATAYEWQCGRLWLEIVHLRGYEGNSWTAFFGRFKLHIAPSSKSWKWAHCTAYESIGCCIFGIGGGDSEQGPCGADAHNDWIAAKWYRRIFADVRLFYMERRK